MLSSNWYPNGMTTVYTPTFLSMVAIVQIFMAKKTQSIILYIFAVKLSDIHFFRTGNLNLKLLLSFSNALPSKHNLSTMLTFQNYFVQYMKGTLR